LSIVFLTLASDAIQAPKDPLEVRLVKLQGLELKGSNKLSVDFFKICGAKVDFKRILNNKEQAVINLIHVQKVFVGGTKIITQGLGEED
jgi:hypothetical protein